MKHYVAFLRGINVGSRRVSKEFLVRLFTDLEFRNARTFIASGNVLFETEMDDPTELEFEISSYLDATLGIEIDAFVRSKAEVIQIGERQVFEEDGYVGATLHVALLHSPLSKSVEAKVNAIRTDTDELRVVGREIYWLCRTPTQQSKVWSAPALKELKLPTMTMRNLRSVRRLIQKHYA